MRRPRHHNRYFVVLDNDRWLIRSDGAFYGPYRTRASAINNAIDTAYLAQGKSQVFLQNDSHKEAYELVWTFGVDAYPPPKPPKKTDIPRG